MTKGLIISLLTVLSMSAGGYYYYNYRYVETLMLSEIVGHNEDPLVNIIVSLGDFDTGLTRNDIQHLEANKDYWISRFDEVDGIVDPDMKDQAMTQLLSDMLEDPVMKKISLLITDKGIEFAFTLFEVIL